MAGKQNELPEKAQPAPRSIRFTAAQDAALIAASREADPINPSVSSVLRDIVETWRRTRIAAREWIKRRETKGKRRAS